MLFHLTNLVIYLAFLSSLTTFVNISVDKMDRDPNPGTAYAGNQTAHTNRTETQRHVFKVTASSAMSCTRKYCTIPASSLLGKHMGCGFTWLIWSSTQCSWHRLLLLSHHLIIVTPVGFTSTMLALGTSHQNGIVRTQYVHLASSSINLREFW